MNTPVHTSSVIRHPLVIILSAIVIAYGGYLFGQWLHGAMH